MKKYKAGQVVFLNCRTHDSFSKESEEYTLTEDMTEEELEKVAEEFFWNTKEPEWWITEEETQDD